MCTMLITLASNVNEKIIKPFTAQMSKVCVLFDFWVIVHYNYSTYLGGKNGTLFQSLLLFSFAFLFKIMNLFPNI